MKAKLIFFGLMGLLIASCSKDDNFGPDGKRTIEAGALPEQIQSYITSHFPEQQIVQAIEEKERKSLEYEVFLSSNYHLEFNTYLYVESIDGTAKLPDSVIPESVLNYTQVNYPNQYIVAWDWEDTYQQVELNNQMELDFTTSGEFIRIDRD